MAALRPDGYYWIIEAEFGAVLILGYFDGEWHQAWELPEDEVTVIEGPLQPPTPEQVAGQTEHFAERNRLESQQYGVDDATWNGALNGHYWVRQQGHAELEIAACYEGNWRGLNRYEDMMWACSEGAPNPDVVYGPIDEPARARARH